MKFLVIGILVLIGIGVGLVVSRKKPVQVEQVQKQQEFDMIPTVDSSTKITLSPLQGNKEIVLEGKGAPTGTVSVDYELSYDTKAQGKQGVIGTISTIEGDSFKKQMTLGTCSSGRCVYHEVVGSIQVTLKFTGDYGEKLFEKEYTL